MATLFGRNLLQNNVWQLCLEEIYSKIMFGHSVWKKLLQNNVWSLCFEEIYSRIMFGHSVWKKFTSSVSRFFYHKTYVCRLLTQNELIQTYICIYTSKHKHSITFQCSHWSFCYIKTYHKHINTFQLILNACIFKVKQA